MDRGGNDGISRFRRPELTSLSFLRFVRCFGLQTVNIHRWHPSYRTRRISEGIKGWFPKPLIYTASRLVKAWKCPTISYKDSSIPMSVDMINLCIHFAHTYWPTFIISRPYVSAPLSNSSTFISVWRHNPITFCAHDHVSINIIKRPSLLPNFSRCSLTFYDAGYWLWPRFPEPSLHSHITLHLNHFSRTLYRWP